jgi:predicted transcriptional regulator
MKARTLKVGVGSLAEALARFEAAFERAARGEKARPERRLTFASLPQLTAALSPARWQLLEVLRREGDMTVYALAKSVGRHYKNVHSDVAALAALGLIERTPDRRIRVPWDVVSAEMRLAT